MQHCNINMRPIPHKHLHLVTKCCPSFKWMGEGGMHNRTTSVMKRAVHRKTSRCLRWDSRSHQNSHRHRKSLCVNEPLRARQIAAIVLGPSLWPKRTCLSGFLTSTICFMSGYLQFLFISNSGKLFNKLKNNSNYCFWKVYGWLRYKISNTLGGKHR